MLIDITTGEVITGGLAALEDVGKGPRLNRGLGNASGHQLLTELLGCWGSSKPPEPDMSRSAASV